MSIYRLVLLTSILGIANSPAVAQIPNTEALSGKYWVRHVLIVSSGGAISEARSFQGSLTFGGGGSYTWQGQQTVGVQAPAPANGSGTYSVKSTGAITMTNPLRSGVEVRGWLGVNGLVGASTEAGGGVSDLLVAIPATATAANAATLGGSYYVSTLDFPLGSAAQIRNAFFRADSNSTGGFAPLTVNGHAVNLNHRPLTQLVSGATYAVTADGSGTLTIPVTAGLNATTQLVNGSKSIYMSADGMMFIGGSVEAGGHDLIVGLKRMSGATASSWRDQFFAAGIRFEAGSAGTFQGSAKSNAAGKVVWSRRVRAPEGVQDFTGASSYSLAADGLGSTETNRVILGAAGAAFSGNGVSLTDSNNYELYVGLRSPPVTGSPVFLNPHGILNAASFAPVGGAIAPGEFITLFGTGIAPGNQTASGGSWPTTLVGVQVLINDRPAPVYSVSNVQFEQVSVLVPFSATGSTATIVVVANGTRSNTVDVPLAASAPGMFSSLQNGIGAGAIIHPSDGRIVNAQNPARRNNYVSLFLTGLGTVAPTIPEGTPAPVSPLSVIPAATTLNVYIGGKRAEVSFKGLAPTYTGLYQINVRVPADAPIGSAVPLAIETAQAWHDQVDIAIAP